MPYSTAAKNRMLDNLIAAGGVTHASLHTADPVDTGASEVAGGAPAYARKAVTFAVAAGGLINSTVVPVFDVPGAVTVTHVGFWSAIAAGTFLGSVAVTNENFGAQGTYSLNTATMNLNG